MRDAAELEAALDLRREVFCGEQGVGLGSDRDGRDHEAVQLVAVEAGAVVGTLRLLVEGDMARLGRMVVAASMRGRGVAARLLARADSAAAQEGAGAIVLHAQLTARGVYERAGYQPRGDVFAEEGIDHVTMQKRLG